MFEWHCRVATLCPALSPTHFCPPATNSTTTVTTSDTITNLFSKNSERACRREGRQKMICSKMERESYTLVHSVQRSPSHTDKLSVNAIAKMQFSNCSSRRVPRRQTHHLLYIVFQCTSSICRAPHSTTVNRLGSRCGTCDGNFPVHPAT